MNRFSLFEDASSKEAAQARTYSVGDVNKRIIESLRSNFEATFWVSGQIRSFSRARTGHCYFDLCDSTKLGENPKNSIKVTLFRGTADRIQSTMKRSGNLVELRDGVEIRIKCEIDFYSPYGSVQLNMKGLDPDFTLGRLAADRARILKALKKDGLIEANSRIPIPLVPLKIALVTSVSSAAYKDATEQLKNSGYSFEVTSFDSRTQGKQAIESIQLAFAKLAQEDRFDAVLLVRGGGSKTDLAIFDSEPVARAIAKCPIAVITGIGHETDSSIADHVAHSSCKTPTAAAQQLIDTVSAFAQVLAKKQISVKRSAKRLIEASERSLQYRLQVIAAKSAAQLTKAEHINERLARNVAYRFETCTSRAAQRLMLQTTQIVLGAEMKLDDSTNAINHKGERIASKAQQLYALHEHRLKLAKLNIEKYDPAHAQKRGWSYAVDRNGKLLRSIHQLKPGEAFTTFLSDGQVESLTQTVTEDPNKTETL